MIAALTYSNLQRYYLTPAYVVGIVIEEDKLSRLDSLYTKREFEPEGTHLEDPYDLTKISDEIEKFANIIKKIDFLEFSSDSFTEDLLSANDLKSAYNSLINKLIYQDLTIGPDNISEIRLRPHFNEMPMEKSEHGSIENFYFEKQIEPIYENTSNLSKIMELARLISWYKYLQKRREDPRIARTYVKNHDNEISKIIGLQWPYVRIEAYVNSPVGTPQIILQKNRKLISIPLSLNTEVSILPFAKSCVGNYDESTKSNLCLGSIKSSFGKIFNIKNNEIHCKSCSSAIDKLKFSAASLETIGPSEDNPLTSFDDDPQYIYITRFDTKLKVGRARLARGISRLLEQASKDALVIYPILSFRQADKLENEIISILKENISELIPLGINSISDKSYFKDKINNIKLWKENVDLSNMEIYYKVISVLQKDTKLGLMFEMTENRIISLKDNWYLTDEINFDSIKQSQYFEKVEGRVNGIIGSFVFVNNSILDLERLQGAIFKNQGFKNDFC